LPEAKAISDKKPKSAQSIKETWDAARVILADGMQAATAQIEAAQEMAPDLLLLKIEDRLARLEDTFRQISAAILTIDKGKEEVLGKTLYTVAQKQRELGAKAEPGNTEEKALEPNTAEGRTIEESAPQEVIRATSEGVLGRKETTEEAGKQQKELL
jgi:hypothetical protein